MANFCPLLRGQPQSPQSLLIQFEGHKSIIMRFGPKIQWSTQFFLSSLLFGLTLVNLELKKIQNVVGLMYY